jgi:heat shock protein HslJ
MKKVLLVLTAFAFLTGCSDETPTPTTTTGTTTGSIEGIWNFTNIDQENGKVTWDGVEVATYTATSSDEVGTFEFKSDGTVTNTVA